MNRRPPRLYKKSGWYYIVFYDSTSRKRKWVALATASKAVAERKAKPMTEAWHEQVWTPFTESWAGRITLADALVAWQRDKRAEGMRQASIANTRYLIKRLIERLPHGITVDAVNEQDVAWIVATCHTPSSKSSYRGVLRAFFAWAIERGHTTSNPAASIKIPRIAKRSPEFLSRDEADRLIEACATDLLRETIRLAIGSGLRRGELIALRRRDIRDGMIHVRVEGSKTTRRERRVPLSPWAETAIDRLPESGPLVPYNRYYLSKAVKSAMLDAGLPSSYHLHTLRHTFASWLRLDGVGLDRIRDWLGHSTIKTTEVYAHLTPESVRDEISRCFLT